MKHILPFLSLLCSLSVSADEVQGIVIQLLDGNNISIGINELQSVKFQNGMMLLNKTNGNQQTISISTVSQLTFSNITTAIDTLIAGNNDNFITITHISGTVVYQGRSQNCNTLLLPHGTYIIQSKGQAHKIIIK